jgi:hypothetical protein
MRIPDRPLAGALAVAVAIVLALGYQLSRSEPQPSPDLGWPDLPTLGVIDGPPVVDIPEPATSQATVLTDVVPRSMPGAAGAPPAGFPGLDYPVRSGDSVQILDGPVLEAGEDWYRVYVLPNHTHVPSDFFAWLPGHLEGLPTLDIHDVASCPEVIDLSALAELSPPDRARCAGDAVLSVKGTTWNPGFYLPYRVEPAWLGCCDLGAAPQPVSLADQRGGPRPPDGGPFLDVQIEPAAERPPLEFEIDLQIVFNHEASAACRRINRQGDLGLPDEAAADSQRWCRWRPVLLDWAPRLGPEGRPVQAGDVQLHRRADGNFACAGVGMAPLVFRIDPGELDPIWLEVAGVRNGPRIVPLFGTRFRPVIVGSELVVLGPTARVVARDGLPFDPDHPPPGIAACPHGESVAISEAPGG